MDAPVEPFKARKLYLVLRDGLRSGAVRPGDRLPSEPELAARHGVSRVTVRRALDVLAMEGLIERRPGSGTFARAALGPQPITGDVANLVAHIAEMGRATTVRLLAFAYEPAPAPVAAALRLPEGARVQVSRRVRLIDGAPFSHLVTHVPEAIGRAYAEGDLATTPLLSLLERSGITVERATQTMTAALAGPEVAESLGVEVGAPLLSVVRTVYDAAGRGVEHLAALYRPDRYAFRMDLVREGAPDARAWAPVFAQTFSPDGAGRADTQAEGAASAANPPGTPPRPDRETPRP